MTAATIRALRRTLIGALIMGVFVVAGLYAPKANAAPGINQQMNFQGRLLTASGATVADGYYNMQFKIYQDGTGTVAGNPSGTLKWTESWLNSAGSAGVQVKNGYMSVQLGSITSLSSVDWNQDTLWLSINVGNTNVSCTPFSACGGDGEMLPMKRLSSTPYAFNAGKLGGLSSAQFLQLAQGVQTEAANNTASIAINKTGTGGSFLNLQANSVDVFTVANTGDISFGNNIDHTIGVTTAAASTAGKSLTISAGTAGTGAGPLAGGTLILQGGNGGGTGGNGGNVTLDAGAAASGGVGGVVNIGTTNASAIILGQNTTLSADKSLTITGSGTRPASPTEGMVYYDTTTKQLIVYSNGKWQSDRTSSTKIVAASNSSQSEKDAADYIATGTSDQSTINTALTAATGGKVYLMEGTYNTDDKITIPNNTALVGAGHGTLIQLGDLAGASRNMIENSDQGGTTGEAVVIRDLRIDGNSSVNTTGTVYGIYMNNLNGSSGASARSGATIANVWVTNMRSDGIRFNTSPNGSVTNSVVQGGGSNGIYLSSSNRTVISGNTIQGTSGGGIWLAGAVNVTVTSNILIANGTAGISLNGTSNNNTISANNLANNGGSGANNSITIANANNNQIIGNSINDNGGTGAAIGIDSASASNYLANNTFNGTGATSISDASTTTVYANQSRSASGGQLTNRTANDAQAFTVQNATGSNIFAVDTSNSQIIIGNSSTAGKLALNDGSGHTGTIQMATGSGNYTYSIPATTANDTFCLVTLNNCAADSTLFIQNGTSLQASANFWIDGIARADTKVLTPTVDTATGVALNIGTATATSVTIGRATTTTTILGNLGVTLNATTGTTITCQNPSGYLSVCDSSVLTPSAANFIQNGTTLQTGANFWIDGYGKVAGGLQTGSVDTIGAGGSLNIGTGNAGSLTIGKTGVTTTIQGNIGVTLNATTGTTTVCRNATGLLSSCDATYLAPTGTSFILNSSSPQASSNFNISGTGVAGTLQAANIVGTTFDTATGVALNIGASGTPTTTAINLNQNVTVAAGKSLTLTGGNTASRPASPTEGMVYYDTDTKQLLTYANGKWQADRTEAVIVAASNSSQADKDAADYVANGNTAAAADGDQVQINQALTAAAGKKVILLAGTYVVDDSVGIPNNTTLTGVGHGTVIELADLDTDINLIYNTDQSTATGVVIRDMKLNGRKDLNSAGNQEAINLHNLGDNRAGAIVSGLQVVNFRSDAIRLLGVGNSTITENIFDGMDTNGSAAIYASFTGGVSYAHNTFSNNYWGLRLDGASGNNVTGNFFYINNIGVTSNNSSQNTIDGNDFMGNTTSIDLYQVTTTVVSNNAVTNSTWRGIVLDTSSKNTVTGNNIEDDGTGDASHNNAIHLTSADSNTITSNTISDSSATTDNYAVNITDSASDTNYLADNALGGGSINDAGTGTIYGGQVNSAGNYVIQPAGTIELMKNTNVTGTLSASTAVLSPNIDRASAGTLTIGTNGTNTTALTIGSSGVTTTIQGNTGVTLNATTGTTMVCRNASGVLATCDAGYLAPTATNFIQNGTSQQASSNFNISGTGQATTFQAATSVLTPLLDAATASTVLSIGTTNASAIDLNQNVTVLAGKSLTLTGSGTRPASPTEGMLYFDTTTHQMVQWNGTKWVNNGSGTYLVAASNSSQADKDAADYVATGTGDQAAIQSALDRADPASAVSGARKSGKVYLFAGTYTISGTISVPNNTTLAGSGAGTVITIPNAVNATLTAITNTTTGGSGTGVVIQDLKLDGNKAGQTGGNYGMYGITFNGMGSSTLQGGKISNVWVNNWYGNGSFLWTYAGIYISGGQRNAISNVDVQGNTNNGIAITGTYNTVTGSDFTGNNYGIHLVANNNTVSGNSASANSAIGIYLETASQNTITGNVATGNTNQNIYLLTSSSNTVSGNQALGSSSSDGIGLASTSTYNIISSNIIQANSSGGVSIASTSTNNTVTGNKIHNNGGNNNKGIYFSNSNSNTITNNTITDTANSASNNPINIDVNSSNTYLSGNTFSSTLANGTIADASTSTIYVSQSKAEGGGQQTNRVANDAAAFTFQNASGTNVLAVDTANSKVLVSGTLDTTTATTLNIGTATATGVNIATNAAAHTVNIANGAAAQTVTLGSLDTTSALTLQGGSNGIALNTGSSSGSIIFGVGNTNKLSITASTISANNTIYSFNDTSGGAILSLDGSTNDVTVAWNRNLHAAGTANFDRGLSIQGSSVTAVYTTPLGASLGTAINISNHDQAAYTTLLALGVTAASDSTARGLLIADARASAHQATLGILSPDENQIAGLSYDGSNTTVSLKNTASTISLQGGGINLLSTAKSGTDAVTTLGVAGTNAGKLAFATAANGNMATVISDSQSGNYTLSIPTLSANSTIMTNFSGIQNQNIIAQAAGFYINGTGQAATLTATTVNASTLDTPSSGILTIGGTNTTSVNVTKDTTIAADKSLTLTGGAARPTGTEGMLWYDTTAKQLLVYSNGKWQADSKNASFIVAAFDSSQADKDGAQYVVASAENSAGSGTGTIDGAQIKIQAAIDAAATAGGGVVYLMPGTYTTDATISIKNGVTLAGSGSTTLIQLGNFGATSSSINMITNNDTTTGTNISVRDIKIDGRSDRNTLGTQRGIYMLNMGDATDVATTNRTGGVFTNLEVTRTRNESILIDTSGNNRFTNIHVHDGGTYGLSIKSSHRNTVTGLEAQTFTNQGLRLDGATRNTITTSIFRAAGGSGVVLLASSNYNTFSNNTVLNSTSSGIFVSASTNNTFTGNITGSNVYGFQLTAAALYNTISGNSIYSNQQGIYLNGLTNPSTNNTISGNNFQANTSYGINIDTANNNAVSGNTFTDSGAGGNNNAIYLNVADGNSITDNVITDTNPTLNYAININDSGSDTNYLSNNRFSSTSGTSTIRDQGTNTSYANQPSAENGGQLTNRTANNATAFTVQNASGTNILAVDTTGSGKVLVSGTLDTTTATQLNIGNVTASAISIGKAGITTTIVGDTAVTLNATTGTGMVCRNTANGILSACDATYLTPTATNFIQNGSTLQTGNFNISGTGQAVTLTAGTVNATTSLVTASIDTATGVALTIGGSTASSVDIGKAAGIVNLKANSTLVGVAAASGNITIQGAAQTVGGSAGNQFILKGSTGSAAGAGGQLTLQGGDGGTTSGANGGNVSISGGAGTGTGVSGLVIISTPTFSTVTNDANCFTGGNPVAANCTITAASVNGSSAVLVGFSTSAKTAILPNPTLATAGRVIYVTASNTSEDFTLSVNGGGQGNQIAMRKNTTATMIWNGAAWTAAGASSSTTMQAAYDNTLQSAGGAELVVSKTSATNGLTIRDAVGATAVNGALLTVQSGSAANLFSVNSNVTEYATDPGAEVGGAGGGLLDNTFPASTWTALTGTTLSRYTTAGDFIATGQGSVSAAIPAATASAGVANRLSTTLTPNMTYNVSFTTRLLSGIFTDMAVYYSVDGTAQSVTCATNQTAKTSIWTKVNCTFQAPASGITANNAVLIRQTAGAIRTFYVDNLSVTIAADYNYATDGDVDDNTNFGTNWTYTTGTGTGTSTRNVSDGFNASSSATATISAGAINAGVRNKLAINPLTSTLYRVSIYAKAVAAFNDFKVRYSPDGGATFVDCVDYNTQVVSTTAWTPITCYIKTIGTTVTNPYVYFVEGSSVVRTYSVDAFSMTLASNTTPNVQIGSGINGGPTTLFTVDKGASAPIAANNDALLGSMYYDTTLGKLQCYESDGWGACGSSPDNIVTISPEYTNAVMHGTGIGTMTSDLCSSSLNINDGTSGQSTICGSNETYNFYKWTSPQATAQTYSIYVTYQLPGTFKEFASGSTSIMGRTDSTNSTVQYQIYRSNSASGLTACGASVVVSTGIKASWQPGQATGAADPSTCSFAASDSVVFKISVTSSSNANAYIGNLGFTYSNR